MSLTGRKKMFDMQGNHLCSIVKEHFHLHSTYVVESAKGDKIMEVKSSFKRKSWHLIWTERGKRGRRMIGRVLVMEVDVTDWC